jgi:hypothetical protein
MGEAQFFCPLRHLPAFAGRRNADTEFHERRSPDFIGRPILWVARFYGSPGFMGRAYRAAWLRQPAVKAARSSGLTRDLVMR